MNFLHPTLAAVGLGAVALPILIHLLMRRRRRPIMWGAMRFLMEAYRKHRRRLLIERWLLLALRCLLVALVGMALGRPLINGDGLRSAASRTVYILIDNSLTASAAAPGETESALDRHKSAAQALILSLASGAAAESNRVAVIGLGGPAESIVLPAAADLSSVGEILGRLTATDSRADVAGGLSLAADQIRREREESGGGDRRVFVVLLSDLLAGSIQLEHAPAALPPDVLFIVPSPQTTAGTDGGSERLGNITITSVEPLRTVIVADSGIAADGSASAELTEQVRISLSRTGSAIGAQQTTSIRASLTAAAETDGTQEGPSVGGETVINWRAGQQTASISVQARGVAPAAKDAIDAAGVRLLDVTVGSDTRDSIGADNRFRMPIELRSEIRVGIVSPLDFGRLGSADQLTAAEWIRLALAPGDAWGIEVTDIEPASLDSARLAALDVLVLPRPDLLAHGTPAGGTQTWDRVRHFAENGGLVIVSPPADATVHLWFDEMAQALSPGGGTDGAMWRAEREARRLTPPDDGAPMLRTPVATSSETASTARDLLALVKGELEGLIRPVSVEQVLPLHVPSDAVGGQTILELADGAPFLWAGPPGTGDERTSGGRGLFVVFASALELSWTDLPAKPLMVPLFQEIVRQGVGQARGAAWTMAGRPLAAPRRCIELREIGGQGRRRQLDEGAPAVVERVGGLWYGIDDRGAMRSVLAVNADHSAGDVTPVPKESLAAWLGSAAKGDGPAAAGDVGESAGSGHAANSARLVWIDAPPNGELLSGPDGNIGSQLISLIRGGGRGSDYAWPLLLGALACCLIEMWVARWSSHASIGGGKG